MDTSLQDLTSGFLSWTVCASLQSIPNPVRFVYWPDNVKSKCFYYFVCFSCGKLIQNFNFLLNELMFFSVPVHGFQKRFVCVDQICLWSLRVHVSQWTVFSSRLIYVVLVPVHKLEFIHDTFSHEFLFSLERSEPQWFFETRKSIRLFQMRSWFIVDWYFCLIVFSFVPLFITHLVPFFNVFWK